MFSNVLLSTHIHSSQNHQATGRISRGRLLDNTFGPTTPDFSHQPSAACLSVFRCSIDSSSAVMAVTLLIMITHAHRQTNPWEASKRSTTTNDERPALDDHKRGHAATPKKQRNNATTNERTTNDERRIDNDKKQKALKSAPSKKDSNSKIHCLVFRRSWFLEVWGLTVTHSDFTVTSQ